MSLVAANPQEPLTRARTPMPYDSASLTPVTCRSRVLTNWRRYRPTRASAYEAPASRAALSASSARSRIPASPGRFVGGGSRSTGAGAVSGSEAAGEHAAATAAAEAVFRKSRREGDMGVREKVCQIADCGLRIAG